MTLNDIWLIGFFKWAMKSIDHRAVNDIILFLFNMSLIALFIIAVEYIFTKTFF